MSTKKVLVTGATGFLGRHLIAELVRRGISVRAALRPGGSKLSGELAAQVEAVSVDFENPESLKQHFHGIDTVFHLAGRYLPGISDCLLKELRHSNVEITKSVVSASIMAGVRRFIHLSSCAVCGESTREWVDGEIKVPVTSYGISKSESEAVFRDISADRLAWTIFRPTVIFGEHRENMVIRLARAMQTGRFVFIGDGKNNVNLIYAADAAAGLVHAAGVETTYGKTYCLNDEPIEFRELVEVIRKAAGVEGEARTIPAPLGRLAGMTCDWIAALTGRKMPLSSVAVRFMTENIVFSNAKFIADTGFEFPFGVRSGVERTVLYWRSSQESGATPEQPAAVNS